MNLKVRKSEPNDIGLLRKIEEASFPDFQKSSLRSLRNSISSNFQEVLIFETGNKKKLAVGSLTLYKYLKTIRIYSIATLPEFRNQGIGSQMLDYTLNFATKHLFKRIILEVHTKNEQLVKWYLLKGFKQIATLQNFYAPGKHAYKMEYVLDNQDTSEKVSNIIVINQPHKWNDEQTNAKVISVKEYINNPEYHSNTDLKIFNLCSSYKYQSYGYYISLLASARGQRIVPSTVTIRDFNLLNVIRSATYDVEDTINKALWAVKEKSMNLFIYFGQTEHKNFSNLALKLYQLFEAPLFEVSFIKHDKWLIKDMKVLTFNKIPLEEISKVYSCAQKFFRKKRFSKPRLVNYKYDLAILVNPDEQTPPSCSKALHKFKQACHKRGIYTEFITKSDFSKLNEFDALFIRETTNVNNYTYEFSRMAYAEGLVVIDDPWSILKCSNKIFQNEIFRRNKILTPQTIVYTENLFDKDSLQQLNYPVVLKQPDSAFSLGVVKANNMQEALSILKLLFKKSDMAICQEFLYSEYDWRIGMLDNTPLFACKYYMTDGHWQIYNWNDAPNKPDNYGKSETVAISEVPEIILKTAKKAAGLIGDGLYGVDLKMIDNKVYVIEVNDNPNIDAGIEDLVLKDQLYDEIINSIYNRIELLKNIRRIDFEKK